MVQSGDKDHSQGTAKTARDFPLSNYYRQQQEMNSTQRSNKTSFRTRVVQSNFRGRPIDKMTEHLKKAEIPGIASIYQQDYLGIQGVSSPRDLLMTPQTRRLATSSTPGTKTLSGMKRSATQTKVENGQGNCGSEMQINIE